ncbi:MAG: hypothetical protein IPH20_11205 [Bacteroidales bacterium]|nr:hypothetical protein [Bacteroidales bacterium]
MEKFNIVIALTGSFRNFQSEKISFSVLKSGNFQENNSLKDFPAGKRVLIAILNLNALVLDFG